jgi:hypothetical protein
MSTSDSQDLVGLHVQVGWWAILLFLTVGIGLETMHGLKIGFYLEVDNETRRMLWRLAHAHGVLFGLLNVAFAASVQLQPKWSGKSRSVASRCLLAALVLMPAGFFLGGAFIHSGDPGLGVLLVPPGALLLFLGVLLTALGSRGARRNGGDGSGVSGRAEG